MKVISKWPFANGLIGIVIAYSLSTCLAINVTADTTVEKDSSQLCKSKLISIEGLKYVKNTNYAVTEKRREKEYEPAWSFDGAQNQTEEKYSYVFRTGLEGKTFEDIAAERRHRGESTHLADFLGSAVFSETPEIFDTLTGLRLGKLELSAVPKVYQGLNRWAEVTGDIYFSETWHKLDRSMQERRIPFFDIVIFRPRGPLWYAVNFNIKSGSALSRSAFLQSSLVFLDRAWRRLSPKNGLMFVELTGEIQQLPEFQSWLQDARSSGVDVEVFNDVGPYLRFRKTSTSPKSLIRPL